MSEPIANPRPNSIQGRQVTIEIAIEDTRGSFSLHVRLTLTSGWTVLFGPSGSGKSTLLRLIAGLDRPRSGRITIHPATGSPSSDSIVLTDTDRGIYIPPHHRRVRLVAQRAALFPHRSVLGNITYGLRGRHHSESDRHRIAEIAALCRIEALLTRSLASLSGGERQRVALARALMPEATDLLLLDEPFTGLPAELRDGLIRDLRAWLDLRGTPVLLVTHDLGEVFAGGATVVRLEQGRVTATGPATVVLAAEREAMLRRIALSSDS